MTTNESPVLIPLNIERSSDELIHVKCFVCRKYRISLLFLVALHLGLVLGLGLGIVHPNLQDRKHYTSSTCTGISTIETRNRCCDVGDCKCTNSPKCDHEPWCNDLVPQPLNQSTCCGSCCGSKCHIKHKTCDFRCGTCFVVEVTLTLQHDQQIYKVPVTCDLDEFECAFTTQIKYGHGQEWECWYDDRGPGEILFNGVPPLKLHAVIWLAIACFFTIVTPALFYWFLLKINRH